MIENKYNKYPLKQIKYMHGLWITAQSYNQIGEVQFFDITYGHGQLSKIGKILQVSKTGVLAQRMLV